MTDIEFEVFCDCPGPEVYGFECSKNADIWCIIRGDMCEYLRLGIRKIEQEPEKPPAAILPIQQLTLRYHRRRINDLR